MLVRDIMTRAVVTIKPEASLVEASRLMVEDKIGGLIVASGGDIQGIVTERDVLAFLSRDGKARLDKIMVEDIMSTATITVESSAGIESAIRLMADHRIKRLPVVDGGRLVGIVTSTDIIAAEPELVRYTSETATKPKGKR